jgi:hypothetical protein
LRDEDLLRDAVTALLRPLLRAEVLPRRLEVVVVDLLVPGVSRSEFSSEGDPVELSCSAVCMMVGGRPRADGALRAAAVGIDTSFKTLRIGDRFSEISDSMVPSSWSDEFGTKVRVRFCERRKLLASKLSDGAANHVNKETCRVCTA